MTVQELIEELQKIEDKSKEVKYLDNDDIASDVYDVMDCATNVYLY